MRTKKRPPKKRSVLDFAHLRTQEKCLGFYMVLEKEGQRHSSPLSTKRAVCDAVKTKLMERKRGKLPKPPPSEEEEEEEKKKKTSSSSSSHYWDFRGFLNEKHTDDEEFKARVKARYHAAGSRDSCGLFSLGRGWQELCAARPPGGSSGLCATRSQRKESTSSEFFCPAWWEEDTQNNKNTIIDDAASEEREEEEKGRRTVKVVGLKRDAKVRERC